MSKTKVVCGITMNEVRLNPSIMNDMECRQRGTNNYKWEYDEVLNNLTEYTKEHCNVYWECKGEYTPIAYQIDFIAPYNHDVMMSLLTFTKDKEVGYTVKSFKKGGTMHLISPKQFKLQALSKAVADIPKMSKCTLYRIDSRDNTVLEKFNGINKDIIKECQKKDREFKFRMVTQRADNITVHTLSK